MTTIGLVVLILVASVISINAYQANNSIDPQVTTNAVVISAITNTQNMLLEAAVDSSFSVSDLNERFDVLNDSVVVLQEDLSNSRDIQAVEARILLVEKGLQALRDSPIEIPTHENTRQFFEMVLLDINSIEQDVFHKLDTMYISGNAGATYQHSVSIKIRDSTNAVIYEHSVGIPQDGRFTTVYTIPVDAELGRYTASITDGLISDSIMFEVQ